MSEKTLYWNRIPGKFVNKFTGKSLDVILNGGSVLQGPQFTGTVREWYETLVETLLDLRNQLYEDATGSLKGREEADVIVTVDPDVHCILESSVLFRPTLKSKSKNVGTLCGMKIVVSRSIPRFKLKMDIKVGSSKRRSFVIIGED